MFWATRALHWQSERACFSPCEPTQKSSGEPLKLCRDGDCRLQLFLMNEECLVGAHHQCALITSLPFVHTARRCYRLGEGWRSVDWFDLALGREADQHPLSRGSKSRNKVAVGEPAAGSLRRYEEKSSRWLSNSRQNEACG